MISFRALGGVRGEGANCYLLNWGGRRILLDAGLNPDKAGFDSLPALHLIQAPPEAILISHAHLRNTGALSILMELYPKMRVYMTPDTLEIAQKVLHSTVAEISRQQKTRKKYHFENYYKHSLVELQLDRIRTFHHGIEFEAVPGVAAKFYNAGHVLGSASIFLKDESHSILYSPEVCTDVQLTMKRADFPAKGEVRTLILGNVHSSLATDDSYRSEEERTSLARTITKTLKRGGSVLIPAFALGRTQELLVLLKVMMTQKQIPQARVFVSGFGNTISEMYVSAFPGLVGKDGSGLAGFFEIPEIPLNNQDPAWDELLSEPAIFVATHGMLAEGTPSARIAAKLLEAPKNSVIFVGYLAPGSPGERLMSVRPGDTFSFASESPDITVACEDIVQYNFFPSAGASETTRIIRMLEPSNIILLSATWKMRNDLEEREFSEKLHFPGIGEEYICGEKESGRFMEVRNMQAVISTVGTSLMANYQRSYDFIKTHNNKEEVILNDLIQFLKKTPFTEASAETNSLERLGYKKDEQIHYLVCSETKSGVLCAKALAEYFEKEKGTTVRLVVVPGLHQDIEIFRDQGLKNLVNVISDIIERHDGNTVINATGGYKAEIAFATLVGILYKKDVFYIHEEFRDLIRLPFLPISFDFSLYEKNKDLIRAATTSHSLDEARSYICSLPEELKPLLIEDEKLGQCHLSPVGEAFSRAHEYYRNRQ